MLIDQLRWVESRGEAHPAVREWITANSRTGMSGCVYGPTLAGNEVWHMTMGGNVYLWAPLLAAEGQGEPLSREELLSLSDAQRVWMALQLRLALGADEQSIPDVLLAGGYPLWRTFVAEIHCYLWEGVLYWRPSWPEVPRLLVRHQDQKVEFPMPRVSARRIAVQRDERGISAWFRNRRDQIVALVAQPAQRGVVIYWCPQHPDVDDVRAIRGAEIFEGHRHPDAVVQVPSNTYLDDWLEQLAYQRLGDVMWVQPDEVESYNLTAAPPEAFAKIQKLEVGSAGTVYYHPEHGILVASRGAVAAAVPYVVRGHD